MQRRGISPIIASILLIVFILVISILIMSFVRKSTEKQIEAGKEKSEGIATGLQTGIRILDARQTGKNKIKISLINTGKTDIDKLSIEIEGDKGKDVVQVNQEIESSGSANIDIGFDSNKVGIVENTRVIPVVNNQLMSFVSASKIAEKIEIIEKSCNIDKSPTGSTCGGGFRNEVSSNTVDDCSDGHSVFGSDDTKSWIEDVIVTFFGKEIKGNNEINIECKIKCSANTINYAIAYKPANGNWRSLKHGVCESSGIISKTATLAVDNVNGEHYVRCIEGPNDISDKTCYRAVSNSFGMEYSDNDDLRFEVISA